MRWDNLKVDVEDSRTLPGYREPATVRTFDAPEALDTRFYEVRSKSALNKVPKAIADAVPVDDQSVPRMQPCVHVLHSGYTPILMADGRTKPIADIRPGDRDLRHRATRPLPPLCGNEVLDHWSTIKPAYRVTSKTGPKSSQAAIIGSSQLAEWKHVTSNVSGRFRAHLTLNDELMGVGGVCRSPED